METNCGDLPGSVIAEIYKTSFCPGWCQPDKSHDMAALTLRIKARVCVELGVYGGRSLFPVAYALRHQGFGAVYAVDPWAREASLEGDQSDGEAAFWGKEDFAAVHAGFMATVTEQKLWPFVRVLHTTSSAAAKTFLPESIDLIHFDSNHSELVSVREVATYLPRIRPGGMIFVDDTNWSELKQAQQMLDAACDGVLDRGCWRLYRKR